MRKNEVLLTNINNKPKNDEQIMFLKSFTIPVNKNSNYGPSIHIQKGTNLQLKPPIVVGMLSILSTYNMYHVCLTETH
jgi:hypothetical protein